MQGSVSPVSSSLVGRRWTLGCRFEIDRCCDNALGCDLVAYDYPSKSTEIQALLMSYGLGPRELMLMGAFVTAYGIFETTLERALWALKGESVEGVRPFTENMKAEDCFAMFGRGSQKLSDKANAVLEVASLAAIDLHDYRNSMVHGYLVSTGPGSTPSFLRNPRWGEASGRKKPNGDAFLDEPVQDLVLVAAWSLASLASQVEKTLKGQGTVTSVEMMKDDIGRARSYANEARHLRSLMNDENY